jgi:osmotically-inducible protein OsmY/sporulation protein YlmC with PRC-barrel domain
MVEPKLGMGLAPLAPPATSKWTQVKQWFVASHPVSPFLSDRALAAQITRVLEHDHLTSSGGVVHLHVAVRGTIATLTGHVVRLRDKTQAEAAASATPGVAAVVNRLVVDNELMIGVAQALGYNPQTQNEQIQVNVQHGVVYLGGTVHRASLRGAAAQIAAAIPQVRGIINRIQGTGLVIDRNEEHFVQPQIGGEIYATDGPVGRVQQVIIDPQTRRVTAVVVAMQIAGGHQLLLPLSRIRFAPSGALFLRVNRDEVDHFAAFNGHNFDAPPADWQPPFPYQSADVLFCR